MNRAIKFVMGVGLFAALISVVGLQPVFARKIILGFVQVSPEGTWRLTNTKSVQDSAKKEGIHLIYRVGSNNYTNQINELRELIDMNVDVISFAPSQVTGWDEVLEEAKSAGIAVIVLDRAIDADDSLYVTHIGSDMIEEGRRSGRWLVNYMKEIGRHEGPVNIAVLEGIEGSTPAVHRDKGFREVIAQYPNYKIVQTKPADYIFSKGEEVMAEFLRAEDGNIDVVYAHNDEMALGAIDAVKAYGKIPGKDVIIVGVDAIKKAFEAMMNGEMNASIECSPLLGPQLMQAVKDIVAGKSVPKRIVTIEADYDQKNCAAEYPNRTY